MPAEIHFFDDSDLGWNASTAWVWDFGDGQTSAEQNPTHIYTEEDAYTVSLTVTSADGIGHIAKPLYVDIGHKLPVTGNSACIILATFVALCGAGFSLRTSRRRLP
ncbi:MAG: PKD domain-containing protein [Candidatus Hydrogenedentes bacterium]|nr:PKD domain-containing protein [Candidatus Hydrogenedentota bacterium]